MQIRIQDELGPAIPTADPSDPRQVLAAIARPRLSGTDGHREAAAITRSLFESIGYETVELPFTYARWAGICALPIAGGLYLLGVLAAGILLLTGAAAAALVVLVLSLIAMAAVAFNLMRLIDRSAWRRRPGINLLFRPPESRPRYIFMAHLDTKSQLLPLSLRGPAILLAGACWIILMLFGAAMLAGPVNDGAIFITGVLAVLAGTAITMSWADNESPGALDNGSGVAALLGVAAREVEAGDVAFLITDAEELGLAGSRAAAASLPPVHGVINVDGLDDDGDFFILERFGRPRRGIAPHLALGLMDAAQQRGELIRRRDVPFGVLLDHMSVVDAGTAALTFMRGTLRSLNRVHRPQDDVSRLDGSGVQVAVDLLCDALASIRSREPTLL